MLCLSKCLEMLPEPPQDSDSDTEIEGEDLDLGEDFQRYAEEMEQIIQSGWFLPQFTQV